MKGESRTFRMSSLIPRRRIQAPSPESEPQGPARWLSRSGLFDREFYEAQTGEIFADESEAIDHCVNVGMKDGLSPSPFLSVHELPPRVQVRWRAGRAGLVLGYLRSEDGRTQLLSPIFDSAQVAEPPEGFAAHPGGPLGVFLQAASEETPLPVPSDHAGRAPTLREARRVAIETARLLRDYESMRGNRMSVEWDHEAESRWKNTVRAHPLPDHDGIAVSVVMAVRNRPDQVRAAINSVQQQTMPEWELLVVDDGSTDETPDVVAAIAETDSRVKLLRKPWQGVCAARNEGIAAATGRYFAFLDSDNVWRSDHLELALRAMARDGIRAAFAVSRLNDPARAGRVRYRAFEGSLDHLLVQNHIDLNVLVCERDLVVDVGAFDPALRRWVDHDLVIKLAKATKLRLLPYIACEYDDDSSDTRDRISTTESFAWAYVVLGKHWVDWERVTESRVQGRISIVIPTHNDYQLTLRAVVAVLNASASRDVEVVVVDNGCPAGGALQLELALMTEDRVQVHHLPRNMNFAIGSNYGAVHSTGEYLALLNNDTEVRRGWLESLLAALEDPQVRGAQALLLYPDDTVQTAGTVFPATDALPCHFLVGHPQEDAVAAATLPLNAISAAAAIVRADEFVALRGFDPMFVNGMEDVDYCLRALEARGGSFVCVTESHVMHHERRTPDRVEPVDNNREIFMARWRGRLPEPEIGHYEKLGFACAHMGADAHPLPAPEPVIIRPRAAARASAPSSPRPSLRWGLRLTSPAGPDGDGWPETHFAASLAAGLRNLGQEVVTYRLDGHGAPARYLDDVALGIRGSARIHPQPGKVNILWITQRPERLDPAELAGFDEVFVASATWPHERGAIRTLYQATSAHQSIDLGAPLGDGSQAVFVGDNHSGWKPTIVLDALNAGVDLVVHGTGWDGIVPEERCGGDAPGDEQLPSLYRRHGLVLVDHAKEIAESGFIANGVFDAVAVGSRVVTDPLPGIEELFGGAVRVYESPQHLAYLCSPAGRAEFATDEEMSAIVHRVRIEHSFETKAQTLFGRALDELMRRDAR